MIIAADKRVRSRMGVGGFRATNYYTTANPGGPAGSSLMTFFAVFQCSSNALAAYEYIFTHYNTSVAGWAIGRNITTGTLYGFAVNSTPALVVTPYATPPLNTPLVYIVTYNSGTIAAWLNGVSLGSTVLGAGYTSVVTATSIGHEATTPTYPAKTTRVLEAGMLDGVDLTASVPALSAQWQEDLQQGRYLTWPRTMTASDWYWSATDIVGAGGTCGPTWTDRGPNAVPMTRTGAPQSAVVIPRF